jgi:hypothetical protein
VRLLRTLVGAPGIGTLAAALAATPVMAQTAADAPDKSPPAATAAPPAAQGVDVGDLWRLVRHKNATEAELEAAAKSRERFLVVAPAIGSKPSTGLNGGLNGNVAFFSGDPATTHISTMSGGIKVSQKQQVLSGVKFSVFTQDDRWFLQSDNRLSWTSLNTYSLGLGAAQTGSENVKFDQVKLYETAYRSVKPGLFVGVGLNVNVHSNIRPGSGAMPPWDESAYAAYNQAHGFSADGQTSGGTSVGLLVDTRDNAINARRGWLASSTYRTFFNGFLGGDSSWQELSFDLRTYKKLTKDAGQRLAFWFMGDLVTGGTAPYLDLPATASDGRSARGYGEGRYRGEHLVYGEVEYRGSLTQSGLFGFVAFLNVTTLDSTTTGERLFDAFAPGAGFGLRTLLNKRSRTNLCTDYGWGKAGSRGFYLGIQEAF